MEEENKNNNLEEIMKDSTLNNPELTFCEKTTYLDFLLSNAKTEEEKEDIKKTINDFLEISKEDDEDKEIETEPVLEEVEIEKVEVSSEAEEDSDDEDEDSSMLEEDN